MSKISKFFKLNKDVLLEYVYNDGNLIGEPYNILINSKEKLQSYISFEDSATNNHIGNQLFALDRVSNKFAKVNPDNYSFLQTRSYSSGKPIRHDSLKFHLPINWTFGEYLGFYVRIYTYDSSNRSIYELSNFYFDITDISQQNLMGFNTPALLFQEKLWGKNISLEIPAVSEIASQLTGNNPTENSINFNLTGGAGLSLNSPIFIDFQFIRNIETINGITNYTLSQPISVTVPQSPEFEKLGLRIENSSNGDFFEIFGTFNGSIGGFNKFIDDSFSRNKRYYVQYNITTYEQNIRGKTTTVVLQDNFNEKVEYRPIIKYSTTTAIIDVEMRLIDSVDESYIVRRASYGMLQDEVSKYSLRLKKINLESASKPKIYNIKDAINPELVGVSNSMGQLTLNKFRKVQDDLRKKSQAGTDLNDQSKRNGSGEVVIEKVKVPFPVLVDRFNIMAKSDNTELDSKKFYGFGKIAITLYPFDNIVGFSIASGKPESPEYLDLTGFNEIMFVIKNDEKRIEFPLYMESGEIDLKGGQITFKIRESKFIEIKKIFKSGVNVFYITGKNQNTTSIIYTGLFKIFDDSNNVADLNQDLGQEEIILDPTGQRGEAIVSRRNPAELSDVPKKRKKIDDLKSRILKNSNLRRRN